MMLNRAPMIWGRILSNSSSKPSSHNSFLAPTFFPAKPRSDFGTDDAVARFHEMLISSKKPAFLGRFLLNSSFKYLRCDSFLSVSCQVRFFSAKPRFDFDFGGTDDAVARFQEMLDEMLVRMFLWIPSSSILRIDCFCRLGRVDYGFAVLGMFFRRGHQPDVVTFTTLVKGLMLKKLYPLPNGKWNGQAPVIVFVADLMMFPTLTRNILVGCEGDGSAARIEDHGFEISNVLIARAWIDDSAQ